VEPDGIAANGRQARQQTASRGRRNAVSNGNLTREEILVVDDEPANLKLLQEMLTQANYRVRLASNGELALRSAKLKRPALILLDIMMPGMDGYEVCRQLKEDRDTRAVPVIFLSALESEQDKVKAFESGGVDYVPKPIRAAEVMARIGTHLALRRAQIELEQRNLELEAIHVTLEERVEERSEELAATNKALQHKIDENLKTLAQIRQSERNQRRLFDNANEGIGQIGSDGKITYVNSKMASLIGYSASEIQGHYIADFVHAEDLADHIERLESVHNGFPQRYERRLWHKDGHPVYALVSVSPILDGAQNFQGAFGMFVDISSLKNAEEQLQLKVRELEERLALTVAALEATRRELNDRKSAAA
jgi:two-component system, LuxR family, sensor kinase FixL